MCILTACDAYWWVPLTSMHLCEQTLFAAAWMVHGQHWHIICLSAEQMLQITVSHAATAVGRMGAVHGDALSLVGQRPTGTLPRHSHRVRQANERCLHVGRCTRNWRRGGRWGIIIHKHGEDQRQTITSEKLLSVDLIVAQCCHWIVVQETLSYSAFPFVWLHVDERVVLLWENS